MEADPGRAIKGLAGDKRVCHELGALASRPGVECTRQLTAERRSRDCLMVDWPGESVDLGSKRLAAFRLTQTILQDDIDILRAKWYEHSVEIQGFGESDIFHICISPLDVG
jgi:hypothetical protein